MVNILVWNTKKMVDANTKYTHWESRQNQLRFFNKVRRGLTDYKKDGLSNLEYKINK